MAYCRWSSDNFGCDLYCYSDTRGYATHVAARRVVGDIPKVDLTLVQDRTMESLATLEKQHREQSAWLKTCRREPIGGPHDGESFNDSTLAAFRERVLMLGAAGYRYPADLIGVIDAEIAERGGQ